MEIKQGDIYWVELEEPSGSEPGYRHPHVVVQNNIFNKSKLNTTVVCALTSNVSRAAAPGNVLLNKGEANLSKSCVVNITQFSTIDKAQLRQKIGTLSKDRLNMILHGIQLLLEPRDPI